MTSRVLIVGGVAGGASTAARLRRLDEHCEIVLLERGPYVSFANCGLPYHVGNVIDDESRLLVASRELFRDRFRIDVRTEHEAIAVDRDHQTLRVRDLVTGAVVDERWDSLVLAPGASPLRPPLPGLDLPGVFSVRNIPDTRRIRAWLHERPCTNAVVVGGGFIGLEMAENLVHRGLHVTVLEKLPQVMPPLDAEMASFVATHLRDKGVSLRLGEGLSGIARAADGARLVVATDAGQTLQADVVIVALGVRPETTLAKEAGLALGARGGIVVDERMRTSDPRILAVGDAVEVKDVVGGDDTLLPLADPANRQGRIAASTITGGDEVFRGVQGTAIVGVLGLTAATTGMSEKSLRRAGRADFFVVHLHPGHHAGYYPGAQTMHLKLIFAKDGRVLGAQGVGGDGVDKRIDVIATTIQHEGTVFHLAEAELCYAPQFGSAKDPVNLAGMMAGNVVHGTMQLADWSRVGDDDHVVVDVREPAEVARGSLPGALPIPLHQLRGRLPELPRDKPLWLLCAAGQRAYVGQRILSQHGFDARVLSGGYATWKALSST